MMLACVMALLSGQYGFGQEKQTVPIISAQGEKIEGSITSTPDDTALLHISDWKPSTYGPIKTGPNFPGGMQRFREYIISKLDSLSSCFAASELKMDFKFAIEKDGKLTDIQILDDGGYSEVAEMAVKALSSSPRWTPASVEGKPVRMEIPFPITIPIR